MSNSKLILEHRRRKSPQQAIPTRVIDRAPPETVQVVTTYFNPCGYARLRNNLEMFLGKIGVPVMVAELAFDNDPFDYPEATIKIRGTRERNQLWQKERLINVLIERTTADAVAWIDGDLIFKNPDFLAEGMAKLAHASAVQLMATVEHTDETGEVYRVSNSHVAGKLGGRKNDPGIYGSPGGAWIAFREDLLPNGVFDRNIVGGGDAAAVAAWESDPLPSVAIPSAAYQADWERWSSAQKIRAPLDFVRGAVLHLYHGSRKDRQYSERHEILKDGQYDPQTDVEIDEHGILQWTDFALEQKPEMVQRVREYFSDRREDD